PWPGHGQWPPAAADRPITGPGIFPYAHPTRPARAGRSPASWLQTRCDPAPLPAPGSGSPSLTGAGTIQNAGTPCLFASAVWADWYRELRRTRHLPRFRLPETARGHWQFLSTWISPSRMFRKPPPRSEERRVGEVL